MLITDRKFAKRDGSTHRFSVDLRNFFQDRLLPKLIFFMGFIAVSPVLAHFGWHGVHSLAMVLGLTFLFMLAAKLKFKFWFLFLALFIFSSSLITGFFWGDFRYLFANIFFIVPLFLLQFSRPEVLSKAINLSSIFMLIIVFGAVIGFLWALAGMPSIWEFPRPGSGFQNIKLYFSTLTNAWWGNIIRPAGIYYEPGALSLYICAIAAIRHLLGKDNKITWVLLVFGFVTFSLAHLIYVFFHLMAERATKNNIKIFTFILVTSFSIGYVTGFNSLLEDKLFGRLVVSEDTGSIQGDNRSFRMFNAIEIMKRDSHVVFFGADPSCRFDYEHCKKLFPPIGENPLTPLFKNGILVTWPFYISLFILFVSPVFGRTYLVSFGFGLLLLQRPEMLILSGAMISSIILVLTLRKLCINTSVAVQSPSTR